MVLFQPEEKRTEEMCEIQDKMVMKFIKHVNKFDYPLN